MTQTQKNIIKASVVIMILFLLIIIAFLITLGQSDKLINSPYNKRLNELRKTTQIGSIYDTNSILLAGYEDGERTYSSDSQVRNAVSHLIGDTYGYCPTGAEITFASVLLNYNESFFSTVLRLTKGQQRQGEDIQLTVDYNLNVFAYDLMQNYSGAVIVQDYTTGEILCMVSTPAFDPESILDNLDENIEKEAFINRAVQGQYAPGSLFHILTAGAAVKYLENIQNREFLCNGSYTVDDETITCGTAHGKITLEEAFALSCDCVFAELGVELGAKNLTNFAEQLKFNYDFNYTGLSLYTSNISVSKDEEDAAFAYAAIGQHEDTVSPLHMSMIAGAIANDGIMVTPKLLKAIDGKETAVSHGTAIMSEDIAKLLQQYMTGDNPIEYINNDSGRVEICCTDAIALSSTDESLYPNSWFLAYINDENHPLAICVITEQSYVEENASADIGKNILEYAYSIGY